MFKNLIIVKKIYHYQFFKSIYYNLSNIDTIKQLLPIYFFINIQKKKTINYQGFQDVGNMHNMVYLTSYYIYVLIPANVYNFLVNMTYKYFVYAKNKLELRIYENWFKFLMGTSD